MVAIAVLWYGYEELVYWVWWAMTGKQLDFYEKAKWAIRVFWVIALLVVLKLST